MLLTFLDLPREIRDIVYGHALISPTGYVTPFLCKSLPKLPPRKKPGRKAPPKADVKPSLRLHLVPCKTAADPSSPCHTSRKSALACGCDVSGTAENHELPLAFSLPRVNRQINAETEGMFWKHNAIIFPNTRTFPIVIKHMGQTPSRHIRRVQITIDPSCLNAELFGRAIKKLASRTRFGSLKHIEVAAVGFTDWFRDGTFKDATEDTVKHSALCHALAKGQHAEWARESVRRVLLICRPAECQAPTLMPWQTEERTLEGLHRSWGGDLILNGERVWDNGTKSEKELTKL